MIRFTRVSPSADSRRSHKPLVGALLEAHWPTFEDELVEQIRRSSENYGATSIEELRGNVHDIGKGFIEWLESGDPGVLIQTLTRCARHRSEQGFAPTELMAQVIVWRPAFEALMADLGPTQRRRFGHELRELEQSMVHATRLIAQAFGAAVFQKLRDDYDRTEQDRQALFQERERELRVVDELKTCIIDGVAAGCFVVELSTRRVRHWNARLEELTGVRAADVLSEGTDVLRKMEGVPWKELFSIVRRRGQLPPTPVTAVMPDGRRRTLRVRAEQPRARELADHLVVVVDDITERELLADSLARLASHAVVERVLSRSEPVKLEGEQRECTVLFADIRGFTGMTERLAPEEMHQLLNDCFTQMVEEICAQDGVVDKFVGDKVMGVFTGEPAMCALKATRAARGILSRLDWLNQQRVLQGLEPIRVGIGVNSGTALMGSIGSEARMDFTVIGDAVNVADRLQSLAAPGEILLGRATAELVAGQVELEDAGTHQLKGRARLENIARVALKRADALTGS